MHLLAWPLVRSHGYTSSRCISSFFDPFNKRSHTLHSLTNILYQPGLVVGFSPMLNAHTKTNKVEPYDSPRNEYCNRIIFPYCPFAKGSLGLRGNCYGQKSAAHHDGNANLKVSYRSRLIPGLGKCLGQMRRRDTVQGKRLCETKTRAL